MYKLFIIVTLLAGGMLLAGCPKADPVSEAREALSSAFPGADSDGDGALTFAEAQAGYSSLDLTVFAELDANGDGVLTGAELNGEEGEPEGDGEGVEPECVAQLTAARVEAGSGGGLFQVGVTSDCPWEARCAVEWIAIENGAGEGQGILALRVSENEGAARSATVLVNETVLTISQEAGCAYSITFDATAFSSVGGLAECLIVAGTGCPWTIREYVEWLTPLGPASGAGSATVQIEAAANTGPAREAIVEIAGERFAFTQESGCVIAPAQSEILCDAAGGGRRIGVATARGCEWTAVSDRAWIEVTRQEIGGGDGWIDIDIEENPGAAREGVIAIGSVILTVVQDSGCIISTSPMGMDMPPEGEMGGFAIFAETSCAWTAVASDNWIVMEGPSEGQGNGYVLFTVARNDGASRRGAIDVGGTLFTIYQEDACAIALSRESILFENGWGFGAFDVLAQDFCEWQAEPNSEGVRLEPEPFGVSSSAVLYEALPGELGQSDSIGINGRSLEVVRGAAPGDPEKLRITTPGAQFFTANIIATLHMQVGVSSVYGSPTQQANDLILTARMPEGWAYRAVNAPYRPDRIVPNMADNTVAFYWRTPILAEFSFDVAVMPAATLEDRVTFNWGISARYDHVVRAMQYEVPVYRTADNGNVAISHYLEYPEVYVPGAKLDIIATVHGTGSVNSVRIDETIPYGWRFVGILSGKELFNDPSSYAGILPFQSKGSVTLPVTIAYRVETSYASAGTVSMLGNAVYKDNGNYSHNAVSETFAISEGTAYEEANNVPGGCPITVGFDAILSLVWPLADRDGDGCLAIWEAYYAYPYSDDINSIFYELDLNNDNKVCWDEAVIATIWFPYAMSLVDENGDGVIHFHETEFVLTPAEFATLDLDDNLVIDCNDLP